MDYIRANPDAKRASFVHDIAAGMHYLHSRNFVHGNLQGGNVLVTSSLTACLSGFGMAKIKHDELSTSTDEAFKKRNSEALRPWMAPERFMGKLTKPTDVWAFGMTVYEIFSGGPPFNGDDPQTIRKNVIGSKTVPIITHLSQMNGSGASEEFTLGMRKIVEKTLVYDRAARPQFNSILCVLRSSPQGPVGLTYATQLEICWHSLVARNNIPTAGAGTGLSNRVAQLPFLVKPDMHLDLRIVHPTPIPGIHHRSESNFISRERVADDGTIDVQLHLMSHRGVTSHVDVQDRRLAFSHFDPARLVVLVAPEEHSFETASSRKVEFVGHHHDAVR
ncbi:hypothetical protein FRC00_013131, partial [Tulasnella sp. 408]